MLAFSWKSSWLDRCSVICPSSVSGQGPQIRAIGVMSPKEVVPDVGRFSMVSTASQRDTASLNGP